MMHKFEVGVPPLDVKIPSLGKRSSLTSPANTPAESKKQKFMLDGELSPSSKTIEADRESVSSFDEAQEGMQSLTKKQIHNLREKKRMKRITDLLHKIRSKLEASGCIVRREKHYILSSTLDYVSELEKKVVELERLKQQVGLPENTSGPSSRYPTPPNPHQQPQADYISGTYSTFENLFSDIAVPACVCSFEGAILECNRQFTNLMGMRSQYLFGKNIYAFCHPSQTQYMQDMVYKIMSGNTPVAYCTLRWIVNGEPKSVCLMMSMVKNSCGYPSCLSVSVVPVDHENGFQSRPSGSSTPSAPSQGPSFRPSA